MSRVSDFQAELLAKSPPRFGRWLKIDLHNHSPSSFDYQGNKSSAVADTAAQIRSNDIDVVMFTDHDGLPDKSFVEQVAQQSGKLILRGAELNVFVNAFDKPAGKVDKNVYFHLLVGFDPASDPDYQITHIKRTFSTETRQAGNQTVSGLACDLNSLIDHLNGVGAIVIPAHLHSGKDAFRTRSIDQIYSDPEFLKLVPKFTALEVTDPKTAGFFDGKHPETKNLLISSIQSSDAHQADHLGRRVSWAQMEAPTFQDLKAALHIPSRISLERRPEPDAHVIGVNIKGSFYPDLWLSMSPYCNAFIGVKGSGKTSVLECLRFALGSAVPESRKAEVEAQRTYILGPAGVVSVLVKRKDGATVLIERSNAPPHDFRLHFDDGRVVTMQGPDGLAFPSYILGWHEIENAATDPAIRRIYLDEISGKDVIGALDRQVTDGVNRVGTLHKELFENYSAMRSAEDAARVLREKRDGLQQLTDSNLIDLRNEYEAATEHRTILNEFRGRLDQEAASLDARMQALTVTLDDTRLGRASPLKPRVDATLQALRPLHDELTQFTAARQSSLAGAIAAISAEIITMESDFAVFNSDYQGKFSALIPEQQRILLEHQRVLSETHQLPEMETNAKALRERVSALLNQLIMTCNQVADRLDMQSQTRREKIEALNHKLNPRGVKLELAQNMASRRYQEYTSRYPQGFQAYTDITNRFGSDRQHRRLAKAYQSILDDFNQGTPLFMAHAEFQNFIETFEEDDLSISFNVGKEGQQFSPINQMSAGQRCTAIFPLLLEIGAGPLIMDQPEDNLDNRHIASSTSDAVIACKPTRQVAFTSHNANLVVLTDAEQIIAFEADGSNGTIVDRGFFAHAKSSIGKHVIDILDGGEKAIEMRNRKYQVPAK
jgi:hypothetical protein